MPTVTATAPGLLLKVTTVGVDPRKTTLSSFNETTRWWQRMAFGVLYGLATATFLTRVVVPALVAVPDPLKQKSADVRCGHGL